MADLAFPLLWRRHDMAFGQPCLRGTGVAVATVVDRFKAGETIASLAADYGQPSAAIEQALQFQLRMGSRTFHTSRGRELLLHLLPWEPCDERAVIRG